MDISDSDGIDEFLALEQQVSAEDPIELQRFARDFARSSPRPQMLVETDFDSPSGGPDGDSYLFARTLQPAGSQSKQRLLTRSRSQSRTERDRAPELETLDAQALTDVSSSIVPTEDYHYFNFDEDEPSPSPPTEIIAEPRRNFIADLMAEEYDSYGESPEQDNGRQVGPSRFRESDLSSSIKVGKRVSFGGGIPEVGDDDDYFSAVKQQTENYSLPNIPDDNEEYGHQSLDDYEARYTSSVQHIHTQLDASEGLSESQSMGTVVHLPAFLQTETFKTMKDTISKPKGLGIGRFLKNDTESSTLAPVPSASRREVEPVSDIDSSFKAKAPVPAYDDSLLDAQLKQMEKEANKLLDMQREVEERQARLHAEYSQKLARLDADRAEFDKIRKEEWAKLKKEKQQLDERRSTYKEKADKLKAATSEAEKYRADTQKLREDMRRKDTNSRLTIEQLRSKVDSLTEANETLKKKLEVADATIVELRQKNVALERNNKMLHTRLTEESAMKVPSSEPKISEQSMESKTPSRTSRPSEKKIESQYRSPSRRLLQPDTMVSAGAGTVRGQHTSPPRVLSSGKAHPIRYTLETDPIINMVPFKTPEELVTSFNDVVMSHVKKATVAETKTSPERTDNFLSTGVKLSTFKNGTTRITIPSLGITNTKLPNGDLKHLRKDGISVYFYSEAGTLFTSIPVAMINPSAAGEAEVVKVYRFKSGQVEKHYADGCKEVYYLNGSKKYVAADGTERAVLPDGKEGRLV
ncbi:T-complex protein-10 [Giardia muris]|uniref:T-complex protein-10 n=1 Tax=Giardia muris TaxID=5742 RepID=A0A4Z1SY23_GIAMU|nr:T-complex protein-10 [Giardia muris]|eukprot:TNJ30604.1 T-complex protein-10 [Giardia muris]